MDFNVLVAQCAQTKYSLLACWNMALQSNWQGGSI